MPESVAAQCSAFVADDDSVTLATAVGNSVDVASNFVDADAADGDSIDVNELAAASMGDVDGTFVAADSADEGSDATNPLQADDTAKEPPIYEQMMAHLQQKSPPIVGIRFELLLDGTPDHLGGKCESQLHVVVVRQVSWQNLNYFACFRLAVMLALTGCLLCYLFGPMTGLVSLYLLNNERLAREFALGLPYGGDRELMSRNVAAGVSSVSCVGMVLHAVATSLFHRFDGKIVLLVVWLFEKFYGLTLITLAFSCVCKREVYERLNTTFRGTETFSSYFINQFNRARSTLVMLAFQHLIFLIFHLNFSEDPNIVTFFKFIVMGCITAAVVQWPSQFYFCCSDFFSIPGLPQFQPPPLFIFGTKDITRVLKIRHRIRSCSPKLESLGISHVKQDHIDSVCVGHVTTERWLSICMHPAVYNSPAWRRLLYQIYTYALPVVNFLFLVLFPSVTVAKFFSHARRSFSDDFILAVLNFVRFFVEKVLSVIGWAIASFVVDINGFVSAMSEFFGTMFHSIANGFESVSAYISAFDQWISYIASRFEGLKKLFALMLQSVQALCVILYKVVGAFTKILPYINNARAVSNTAASVDVVGRWSHSGWLRNVWLRWFARRKREHSE